MKHLLEYAGFRIVLASLAWTPMPIALRLSRFYFRVLDRIVPKLRKAALRNLQLAALANSDALVDGVYGHLSRLLVLFSRLPRIQKGNVGRHIRYEGLRNYQEAKRRGKGILIATGHFGNWEFSAHAHALLTEPMHVVVRPLDNPRIDALVERYRGSSGNQVITKKDAARGILRALKEKRSGRNSHRSKLDAGGRCLRRFFRNAGVRELCICPPRGA
ncbi:MAG: lysophospholipid acyltransferase family protein [Nibricoccus sp.]